ncbi:MAG: type IV secretory system conjugative DNA transfer family protein, partial [Actinomycetes bacterium]
MSAGSLLRRVRRAAMVAAAPGSLLLDVAGGVPLAVQGCVLLFALLTGCWAHHRSGARLRRRLGGAAGWLGLVELLEHAGSRVVRRQARAVRPGLSGSGHPISAYAATMGRLVSGGLLVRGRKVYSPWSRGILVWGPQGSGKSSWLVGPILEAPGAAYVSSTKTELVAMTARLRAERGPVHVFNPTGLGGVESTFGWDPVAGCEDPSVADARARALVRGGGGVSGGEHSDFWAARAAEIVRCYLLAAALHGQDMTAVMEWAQHPDDTTPLSLIEQHPVVPAGWVGTMQRNLSAAPNERSGYFAAIVPAVSFMDNPLVAAACRPGIGASLDLAAFLRGTGTIYVIAGEGDRRVAPLLTALTEATFGTAKQVAAGRPGGRLDPPLTLFLDEIAQTTPVPLDLWAADSRGWGITVCAVVQ